MPAKHVITYNVHACRGTDGVLDIERCVAVLADLQPALIGLQEVDSREGRDVWRIFEQAFDMHAIPGPTLTGASGGHYGNLLLSRYPSRAVRHYDLSVGPREPRRAIDALLDTPRGPLRVLNTHLGLRIGERRRQLGRLCAALSGLRRGPPTLVLGDFNTWLFPGRIRRHVHRSLHAPALPCSYPAALPCFALDQIWCYPADLIDCVRVLRTPIARLASDHLPVVARLRQGDDSG